MTSDRRATLLVVLLLLALAGAPLAQGRGGGAPPSPGLTLSGDPFNAPMEAGTSAISGVVVDSATKAPIAGAIVYLGPLRHGPPGVPNRQLSDAMGRFVFRNLPAFGGYFLQVTKLGYLPGVYGRGLGARIAVLEGQWFANATVTMSRPASVTGRVIDHLGEPVVGVYVRVLGRIMVGGRPRLAAGAVTTTDDRGVYRIAGLIPGAHLVQVPVVQSSLPASAVLPSTPADEGRPVVSGDPLMDGPAGFRVRLGGYVTPLAPIDGRTAVYPATFHPNATSMADAAIIDLKSGESRTGADVELRPVPSFTVSGVVQGPADALLNMTLRLVPQGAEGFADGGEAATALVGQDGAFMFLNVPAGSYTLDANRSATQYELSGDESRALPRPPGLITGPAQTLLGGFTARADVRLNSYYRMDGTHAHGARVPMTVAGQDMTDVVVTLKPLVRMTGRFVWAHGEGIPPGTPVTLGTAANRVTLFPAAGDASLGSPQPRGASRSQTPGDQFTIEGLFPGEYVLDASLIGRVKAVTWRGRDFTRRPFDASTGEDFLDVVVTMTSKSITLAGTVRDGPGIASEPLAVIVFPREREQWADYGIRPERLRSTQTTSLGVYRFSTLPAGDYYVVAVAADYVDGWQDPAFLERIERVATPLTLEWGANKTQDLKLVVVK